MTSVEEWFNELKADETENIQNKRWREKNNGNADDTVRDTEEAVRR